VQAWQRSFCASCCRATDSRSSVEGKIANPAYAADDEEIIVSGRTRATLRLQIELAADAFYERFKEIGIGR
jgi:hypothetical protein